MRMLRKTVCLLMVSMWAISVNAQGQGYRPLRGRVLQSKGEAVAGAVVSCIELPDSTAIAYCVTNDKGWFQITGLVKDHENYLLEVSFIGYKKACVKPTSEDTVITLEESDITLDEVVVTASAPGLKQKPGKFIYTPRLSEVGGIDSYELLRYTPLMTVENNTVSILGKGTSTVYVNGREPIMDNASLMEMLRSVPPSQIENIEIIISPNSSHKASTTGGIVNIVMKKNPNQGLTGSASVSGTYLGEKVSPRTSLYLGYSKDRFNASANLSYQYYNSMNETDITYNYKDTATDIINSTVQQATGHFLNGNINISYDFTERSTMGASFHIGGTDSNSNTTTSSSSYFNGIIDKQSISANETSYPFRRPEISVVAYYNMKTDDNGSNLDISANYSSSTNVSLGNMEYANDDKDGANPYSQFQQNSAADSYGYEFKGHYSHYFDDVSFLKAGYEFNASHLSNDFVRNDFDGSEYIKNETYSNHFIYDEKVNAVYATYDRMWSDILSTTVGIRAENTDIRGNQITSEERFHRNYWNLFPQLSVLVDLADGDHSIALDLSRSIVRPFYNDLNPFKIWTSENTYTTGNIHIEPMIYNDVDLSYSFLGDYIIGASYSYGSDAFSEYSYLAEDNTTVSSVANFGHEQTLSIYFNMDKVFFNGIWRMSFSATAEYDTTKGNIDGRDISYKSWLGSAGIRNIFRISSKRAIRATVSYNYYTPARSILKIGRHKHLLNASLTKEFKFGGSLGIDALNLLNYKPSYHYNSQSYSFNDTPITNNISIQLRYTHKFGHSRVRGAQDRSSANHLERFKKQYQLLE